MGKLFNELKNSYIPAVSGSHLDPYIGITADKEAVVEGCKGIVEYTDTIVSVNCKSFIVHFRGFSLSIKSLSKDCIAVTGTITEINFCVV